MNDKNDQKILPDANINSGPKISLDNSIGMKDKYAIKDGNIKKSFENKIESHTNTEKLFPTYIINIAKPYENKFTSPKSCFSDTKIYKKENFSKNQISDIEDKSNLNKICDVNKDKDTPNNNLISSNNVKTSNNIIITINNYECEKNKNFTDRNIHKDSAKLQDIASDQKKKNQLIMKKNYLKQLSKISERSNMVNKESDNSLDFGSKKNTQNNLKELTRELIEADAKLSNSLKNPRSNQFKLTASKKETLNSNPGEINEYFTDSEGLSETEKEEEKKIISEIKSSSDSDSDLLDIPNTLKILSRDKKEYFTDFINKTPETQRTCSKLASYKSLSFSRPGSSIFLKIKNKRDIMNKSMSKEVINFKYDSELDQKLCSEKQKLRNESTHFIIHKVKTYIENDFIFFQIEKLLNKIKAHFIFRLLITKLNSTKRSITEAFWEGKPTKTKFDNRVSLKLSNIFNKRYFNIQKKLSKNNFIILNEDEKEDLDCDKNLIKNFKKNNNRRSQKKHKAVKIQKLCTARNFNPKKISHASNKFLTQNTMQYPIQTKGSELELNKFLNNFESRNKVFEFNISNIAYCDKFLQLDLENYLSNFKSDHQYAKAPSLEKLTSYKDTTGRNTEKDNSQNINLLSRRTSLNIMSSKNLDRPFDVHDKIIGFNNLSKKTFTLGTMSKLNPQRPKFGFQNSEVIKNRFKGMHNISVLENNRFFQIVKKHSIQKKRKTTHLKKFQKLLSIRRVQQEFNKQTMLKKKSSMDKVPLLKSNDGEMLNKECMMNRTHEIKSNLVNRLKNPIESLKFYMKDDNFAKFKEILEKNKSLIEQKDINGNTLLNLASQYICPDIATFLIEIGADVNTQNNKMNTPLHYALSHKNFQIADILITRGAKEDTRNSEGLTPWQCLARAQMIV